MVHFIVVQMTVGKTKRMRKDVFVIENKGYVEPCEQYVCVYAMVEKIASFGTNCLIITHKGNASFY